MSRPLTRILHRHSLRHFSSSPARRIMDTSNLTPTQLTIRDSIAVLCARFPNTYWREHDQTETDPVEFHAALARDGWLGIALPASSSSSQSQTVGAGLGIGEATAMMQAITESGAGMAGAQAVHANVYATQPIAKFGSPLQLSQLADVVTGKDRVCFGVTEPNAGLDTLKLRTRAEKQSDGSYLVTGQKVWITAAQVASKMILLARTTPLSQVTKPSDGLSLFFIPLDRTHPGLSMRRIKKMGSRAVDANEVFFESYPIPASSLVGEEGQGFKVVLHGMNAERCLIAGEALGLGYAALKAAVAYVKQREVFGRVIGMNQGVAHPLSDAFMRLEAAKLSTYHAASLYDASCRSSDLSASEKTEQQIKLGVACNSAKYTAAEAAFVACERAVLAHGGMGYAAECDVERWFRDCLVPRIAPVSREMVLNYVGEKALGLPRSY